MAWRVALGLGVAVLIVALLVEGLQRAPRRVGTDNMPEAVIAAALPPHAWLCESASVPEGTVQLRFTVVSPSRPGARVSTKVVARGRTVARGSLPSGWTGPVLDVPFQRPPGEVRDALVCLRVNGGQPLEVMGVMVPPEQAARIDGRKIGGRVAVDFIGAERSWLAQVPTIAERNGVARGWPGSLALAIAAVLLVAAAGSIGLALRTTELRT